jgi:hypothetical protein
MPRISIHTTESVPHAASQLTEFISRSCAGHQRVRTVGTVGHDPVQIGGRHRC